jgi:head-tail adaptor
MALCGKYSAGQLREIVAIEAKLQLSDGMGGFTVTWSSVSGSPTRAMLSAAPGNEKWGFMRQTPGNTYKMVTRWFSGASAAQRVTWKGGEYGVLGVVDPDGKGDWLEWRLSDGVAS